MTVPPYDPSSPYGTGPQDAPVPPPPAPPYGAGYGPAAPAVHPQAVQALIWGIVALPLSFVCVGIVPAIVAIVLGRKAMREIAQSDQPAGGQGRALTGVVLGVMAVLATLLWSALVVWAVNSPRPT